ncbi:hypothetical protein [Actinomadura rupiterrae]|uniref:hypothetical protein n=1 Tax=Actinomadura rupiterrae TaxID=559627 RepID=UPI0020A4A3C4|nr:hypothetical protein [Actinomadura rupiterrae]MCP2340563.1 hypothetical protein [Actinomadura rupiterrae]
MIGFKALAAAVVLAGATTAIAAPAADASTQAKRGWSCRNAYTSTTGAWGSARICWISLGKGFYKIDVAGTVKDTKGDGKRAALYIHTWDKGGHSYTPRVALATKYRQVRYGHVAISKVKYTALIYVCTVDRFNTSYRCSKDA